MLKYNRSFGLKGHEVAGWNGSQVQATRDPVLLEKLESYTVRFELRKFTYVTEVRCIASAIVF